MRVLVAQGLPVEFDLSHKAFVFEDTADPTSIILDYRGNIVVFKVRFNITVRTFYFIFIFSVTRISSTGAYILYSLSNYKLCNFLYFTCFLSSTRWMYCWRA